MKTVKPFRLAFRKAGKWVNCYLAQPDTMEGAKLMASVLKRVVDVPEVFEAYKIMMRLWATATCEDVLGAGPSEFITEPAPEHERSGEA